jgi:hypothetical protein
MPFSNKNLIDLSKFTIKARGHIGLVKASDMLRDEQYATEVLVKAALSENEDLITLTKLVSSEFNASEGLINSSQAYVNYLKASKASDDLIHESKYYLIKLNYYLHLIDVSGAAYRQAVNNFIRDFDSSDHAFCIKLAREYYYFWNKSKQALVTNTTKSDLNFSAQKDDFMSLWHKTDDVFYSGEESWAFSMYTKSMKHLGASDEEINIRLKIAKVITLEAKKNPDHSEDNYRDTINIIQSLLSTEDMKKFFVIVSREYYHFWLDSIQAVK